MSQPLYALSAEYAALQAAAEDGADCEAALAALTDALEVKAERIAALLRNLDAEAESLAAEEKRLAARRKARENAYERLAEYLRANMEAAGIERIKAPKFTLYLQVSESVAVEDIDAVPVEYLHPPKPVEKAVAKKAVLDAHKKLGECVPGCRIVRNLNLIIK
jgi:hypothetical protein